MIRKGRLLTFHLEALLSVQSAALTMRGNFGNVYEIVLNKLLSFIVMAYPLWTVVCSLLPP